jgi:hypothetical protein
VRTAVRSLRLLVGRGARVVPGQRAGSGKAAAGFRIPRPSAGELLGEGRVGALRAQGEL